MNIYQLIIQTIRHFWKQDLVLALGVALNTAVITGALIVGDSVQYSLEKIVSLRLGEITHAISAGDRYFTDSLAIRLESAINKPVTSLLLLEGTVTAGSSQYRLPKVQVLGIHDDFAEVAGSGYRLQSIAPGEAFISRNLADQLALEEKDEFLLRVKKLSLIPLNTPFVSDAGLIRPVSIKVAGILDEEEMGRFHLKNIQTAPFNIFLDQDFLNEIMETSGKVNHLLIAAGKEIETAEIEPAFSQEWDLEDINLNLRYNARQQAWELTSERIFIDKTIQDALPTTPYPREAVLTYFVNSLSFQDRETPYSFVSTLEKEDLLPGEVIINEWLAEDLGAGPKDTIRLDYFVIGPLRKLEERSSPLVVKKVVPLESTWADKTLTPQLPGLSDASNCRDWETGIPIDLEKIRTKDENYWDNYKGTPKAFVAAATGRTLWQNRFGESTIIRFKGQQVSRSEIEKIVKDNVDPLHLGFKIEPVKINASIAAKSGVDFSMLFIALSFFLVVAGILLTFLLFILNTERRMPQIGTLSTMGFTNKDVKKLFLGEGLLVSMVGSGLGLMVAMAYNEVIFTALNSIWADIVRTQTLVSIYRPATMLTGFLVSVLVSFSAIFIYLNRLLNRRIHSLQSARAPSEKRRVRILKDAGMYLSGLTAIAMVIGSYSQTAFQNTSLFFIAGSLSLISLLLLVDKRFRAKEKIPERLRMTASMLIRQNIKRNPTRSFLVVALLAIGTFIIVSTGVHRRDLFSNAQEKSSGTGGFLFFAESTIPVLHDLNDPATRFEEGLEAEYPIVQLRALQGDDASCLNLNRASSPRLLGVDPEDLSGRFEFVSKTAELNPDRPWLSLNGELTENTIPAIADQTVIQWGLGFSIGDTLQYLAENGSRLNLKLIGGLANSIFQGNVLISQENFLQYFPSSSGSHVFLVDGQPEDKTIIQDELRHSFRDYGWMMQEAADRLAEFNSVENTYLSIFLVLGGLGLIIGTISLGLVLLRNLLIRRNELGMMQALGFPKDLIVSIFTQEHFRLLLMGVGIGIFSSVLAALPSWTNPHSGVSPWSTLAIMSLLLFVGITWIVVLVRQFLKKERIITSLRKE